MNNINAGFPRKFPEYRRRRVAEMPISGARRSRGAGTRDVTNMGIRIRVGTSNSHHRGSQEPNEFTHTYKFVPVKKKAKNILA